MQYSEKVWVLLIGGMLGILMMRTVAKFFLTLIDKVPELETTAFVLIGIIALKMAASVWHIEMPHSVFFIKLLGAAYLAWLVIKHFFIGEGDDEANAIKKDSWMVRVFGVFWATVISVELMDLAFSVDSILAAFAVSWGLIGSLVVLEGLLSADNALVLAVMVKHLPEKQRKKALTYGLIGAYFFRFLFIGLGMILIKFWWIIRRIGIALPQLRPASLVLPAESPLRDSVLLFHH
ncbi:hypothetical protein DT075_37825 [Bacillus licheniformis]|nr:hypothetical protein DT075_37825 [Bacillus licheniformis]